MPPGTGAGAGLGSVCAVTAGALDRLCCFGSEASRQLETASASAAARPRLSGATRIRQSLGSEIEGVGRKVVLCRVASAERLKAPALLDQSQDGGRVVARRIDAALGEWRDDH